jgi:hypothetical protein
VQGELGKRVTYWPNLILHPDVVVLSIPTTDSEVLVVNVYNSGPADKDVAVRTLMESLLPWDVASIIMGGDFNLHHPNWLLPGSAARQFLLAAGQLAGWIEGMDLTIMNPAEVATRRSSGSVIDLVFTNHPGSVLDVTIGNNSCSFYSDCHSFLAPQSHL